MVQFDYVSNSANGHDAQDVLQNKLLRLRRDGDLSIVVKTYRAGDPAALNAEQFYAPFMIQFNNGSRWIVFSTTSCRTDRIKGQQWDADNLKRLDASIERAVLAYPDDVSAIERRKFQKQKEKYETGREISRIDDILSHKDLIGQIQRRAEDIYNERWLPIENGDEIDAADDRSNISELRKEGTATLPFGNSSGCDNLTASDDGRAYDFNGRAFERDIAALLKDGRYLEMIRQGVEIGEDKRYGCFVAMLNAFKINPNHVIRVAATAEKEDIGLLPNGGQPKTDVLARFILVDGEKIVTISCKRTKGSAVSVHQYNADAFADVLDSGNETLRELLQVFQFYANAKDMPQIQREELKSQLVPLRERLCRWAIGGFGGLCSDVITQCAQYLVVYNPQDAYFAVHSVEDYVQMLLRLPPKAFGTPFYWTYASKQRQKTIQLKVPIVR